MFFQNGYFFYNKRELNSLIELIGIDFTGTNFDIF